jgi:Tol biopolymer transport system component
VPICGSGVAGTLWWIDADGSDAVLLGDPDTFDVEPRISPDGGQVAFMRIHPEADWVSEIVVRDVVSGDERIVVPLDVPVDHPEWSPDGSSLISTRRTRHRTRRRSTRSTSTRPRPHRSFCSTR